MKRRPSLIFASLLLSLSVAFADDPKGALKFENAEVQQVLPVYKELSGLELVVDSRVKTVRLLVTIQSAEPPSRAEAMKLIEKAMLEQAGVVIAHLDDKRASVTFNDALPVTKSGDTTPKEKESETELVTGIGGVFFKVKDPKAMAAWYRTNLGIQSKGGYTDFLWRDKDHPEEMGHTAWRMFPPNTTYFGQSPSPLMINYRVSNMDRMLEQLRTSGVKIEKVEDYNYGRFAWIEDPEGNRIELWEPKRK